MNAAYRRQIAVWMLGVLAAVALIGGANFVFSRAPRTCAVCRRAIDRHWAFKALFENAKTVETCCSRCGFRYVMTSHHPVRAMWAADFFTGQWLPAQDAIYVSGSRLAHCSPTGLQRDGQGCCSLKVFDRCLPSLAAFKNRDQAQRFQAQYGGQIMTQPQVFAGDDVINSPWEPAGNSH